MPKPGTSPRCCQVKLYEYTGEPDVRMSENAADRVCLRFSVLSLTG